MKKMLKIAFIIRDINHGGAAKMMTYYANIATEVFDEVYVIVIGEQSNQNIGLKSAIKKVSIRESGRRNNRILRIISDIKGIRKVVEAIAPDILMPFASGNTIFTYLAVGHYHAIIGTERGNPEVLPLRLVTLCKYIYPRCDYMLFQSWGAAAFYFKDTSDGNYEVIPNPCLILSDRNRVDKKLDEKYKIVSASRLAIEKNIDILIQAFNKSSIKNNSELHIYGDGPEEKRLKNLRDELGLQKIVIFHGKTDNTSSVIADADVFVLASSGEGMPNGLIEAMGLGIPCISTMCMCGNTNDLITDGINGLIVKKRDVDGLSDALERLINNKELSNNISRNAVKIRDQLSENVIHKKIENFYLKVREEALNIVRNKS